MWKIYKLPIDRISEYPSWMELSWNAQDPIYGLISIEKNLQTCMSSQIQPIYDNLHWFEMESSIMLDSSGSFFGDGWEIRNVKSFSDYHSDIPTGLEFVSEISGEISGQINETLYSVCYVDDLSGSFYLLGESGIYHIDLSGDLIGTTDYNSVEETEYVEFEDGVGTLAFTPIYGTLNLHNIYYLDSSSEPVVIPAIQYITSGQYVYIPEQSGTYLAIYDRQIYQMPANLKTRTKARNHYLDSGFLIFGNNYDYAGTPLTVSDVDVICSGTHPLKSNTYDCRPGKTVSICFDYEYCIHESWNSSSEFNRVPLSGAKFYSQPAVFSPTEITDTVAYYNAPYLATHPPGTPYFRQEISGVFSDDEIEIYPINKGTLEVFYWSHMPMCYDISGQPSSNFTLSGQDFQDYIIGEDCYIPLNVFDLYITDPDVAAQARGASISKFSATKNIQCKGMTRCGDQMFFITDELIIFDDRGNRYFILDKLNEVVWITDSDNNKFQREYMHFEYNPEIKVVGMTSVGQFLVIGLYCKRFSLIYYNPYTEESMGFEFQHEFQDPKDFTIGHDKLYVLDNHRLTELRLRFDYAIFVNNLTYLRENYSRIWKL